MTEESSGRAAPTDSPEPAALQKFKQVDDWIAIEPDGTIRVMSGKVELGTGIRTALAQIVAEELDIPFERIRMVMGETGVTPDEGYTAGSKSIQVGGAALRYASAEARRALLEMASDRLDAAIEELSVSDGVISVTQNPELKISYAELMGGKRFRRTVSVDMPLKRPDEYRIVGQSIPRIDLPFKFTGAPSFVQDVRLPEMRHARVIRPPSIGAQWVSVDSGQVHDVQLFHLGNFIALVAEREEQVVAAAKSLKVTWKQSARLPRMANVYSELVHQPATDRVIFEQGDLPEALKLATTRANATYYQPYQAHASIGPSCAVADYREDHVTVWCSTQGVYPLRDAIADMLKLSKEQVHIIHVEGAGCYGHNGADDVAADAAILSRAVGKPVRVQWSRENEFAWEPYAPAMVVQLHGGLDEKGNLIAWDYQAWSPSHAVRVRTGIDLLARQLISGQPAPSRNLFIGGDRNAQTNYVIPNQQGLMHWLARSPLRASSFRSLGAAANTFANESFIDELASSAHIDPLRFRLRHIKDARAQAVLNAVATEAGWGTPIPSGVGKGLAFAQYENEEAYVATVAVVRVDTTSGVVRVQRVVVAHDCGLIINPEGLRNQIEGNVIQSSSRALKEEVTFDESGITSLDWDTYPILKFTEVPDVQVILINHPDQRALGAGEPSTITTAPAIANAIFAATGLRLRQIPFTPQRVREAKIHSLLPGDEE